LISSGLSTIFQRKFVAILFLLKSFSKKTIGKRVTACASAELRYIEGRNGMPPSRMPPSCCGYQRMSSGFSGFTDAILLSTIIRLSASTLCSSSLCRHQADLLPFWFNYNGNPPRVRYHLGKSGAILISSGLSTIFQRKFVANFFVVKTVFFY
jgi:hypothetical protein